VKTLKLLLVCGMVFFCRVGSAKALVGQMAPKITVQQWVTENPPDVKRLANKVYVLEFWATWCHACVQEIPNLIELNNKYRDSGMEFISLSQDRSADMLRKFVRDKGMNYHVAIDNGTTNWYGIRGYPTVVIVNHQGKVAWEGYPWSAQFEKALEKAIAAAPAPLLAGVDLGPFDSFRKSLRGGGDFADSYRKIESHADNWMSPKHSAAAKRIVGTINRRIAEKTRQAHRLAKRDPAKAYSIYADIVARYGGIEAVEPARAACLELEKRKPRNKAMFVSRESGEAE
jgi:thiol-disulfide isomerase/thioredoxin